MVLLMLRRGVLARPLRRSALLLPGAPRASASASASRQLLSALSASRGVSSAAGEDGGELVYEAPLGRSVRLMKGVSLTSCVLTSVGMPMVTALSEQSASVVGKVLALRWCTRLGGLETD
jgi:hypothetical protein